MAGADTSKVRLNKEEIVVPENLSNGNKFLKWDEDSSSATPVTLKVDPHGHFLYWKFQNKDVDCLELTQIRDTRTGKYALTPKDAKTRDLCDMGAKDESLEDKTVTVVYGSDFVNINFINFCANSSKVAQEWCEKLLKLGHNSSSLNPSPASQLHKIYTKLTIMVNREGHIPVKNIRKMFSSTRSDMKKVETALQVAGVHSGKDDTIDPKRFTYDVFFTFFLRLVNQKEVDKLFQEMGAKNKPYLTTDHLVKFLNNQQRDPRLNEILYPFYDAKQAMSIIEKFEKNKPFAKKGHMSIEGLIRYLLSEENQIDCTESYLMSQDMEQPLSHYFVKSSHNTYLTGHQLTGKSSVEIYRQVLLAGCRCVELDCWDGRGDTDPEPIITHGYTMCTDVLFKDVIEAINESAFKTSDYPVVLSFENHCNQKQQAKMAHYCRTIFGDKLLIDPLSEYPLESGKPLPHPAALKFKILVKNKKRKHSDANKKRPGGRRNPSSTSLMSIESGDSVPADSRPSRGEVKGKLSLKGTESVPIAVAEDTNIEGKGSKTAEEAAENGEQTGDGAEESSPSTADAKTKSSRTEVKPNGKDVTPSLPRRKVSPTDKTEDARPRGEKKLIRQDATVEEKTQAPRNKRKLSRDSQDKSAEGEGEGGDGGNDSKTAEGLDDVEEESDDSDDEEALSKEEALKKMQEMKDRGTAGKEAEAGAEMSALVNYVQPVHFSSFETSERKNHSYEISSFVETSAMNRVKENPVEFVNYNKRQLSRIYPKGTRVDSSNFMPQIFWNCGCQLVALNYQNLDLPMQLNLGLFNQNGRTGYILKPDFMRRKDRHFDPFSESTMDGIVAATVKVRVISGHFLSEKRTGTYIEVDMFGLPADTVRKKNRTKTVSNTALNPQFDDDGFVFEKVIMPKLAMLRITAYDDNNKQLGHRILPVDTLRPGYRHIPLRNDLYQPLLLPSVFVHIEVRDYVPKGLANFADALVNPIMHQNLLEEQIRKREEALSKLMEEVNAAELGRNTPDDTTAAAPTQGQVPKNAPNQELRKEDSVPPSSSSQDPSQAEERKMSTKPLMDIRQELEKRDSIEGLPPVHKKLSKPSKASEITPLELLMGAIEPQEEIVAATIDEIKQEKRYQKVLSRLDSELQKMVKKHEKKQSKLKKSQAKDLNKFRGAQEKARRNKEKKNQSAEKKAMKSKHGNVEEVKKQCAKVMETLVQEQEKELLKKQVSQEDVLVEMYRRHLMEEKELKKEHAEMLFELQMDLMTTVHEKQLKKLDGQHKKVEHDLRKMLESKNIDEMKSISKMKREKQEINRLKREARNKHIEQAVTERTRLIQLHDKKRNALKEEMKELQQNLSEEEETMVNEIEVEYKGKCDKLVKDRKYKRMISDTNGSVPAVDADSAPAAEMEQNGDTKKKLPAGSSETAVIGAPETPGNGQARPMADTTPGVAIGNGSRNGGAGLVTAGDASHVAGEVEVHASINGKVERNTNNSAQTHPNGSAVTAASHHGDEEAECKDSETGERRTAVRESPSRITPVVESTKL